MAALLALAFGLATISTAIPATINWRRRRGSSAYIVVASMGAGVSLMNALNAVHCLMPYEPGVSVILSIQSVVSPAVIGAVVCMAAVLADRAWLPSRRTVLLLAIEPALMLLAAATNPWHHALFGELAPIGVDGILVPVRFGPVFWAGIAYIHILLWITAIQTLVIRRRATSPAQRRICTRVLLTYAPPMVVALLIPHLPLMVDPTPLGQAVTLLYVQVRLIPTLPRHLPVAHRQVFATITDAVAVVDRDGRIIEINPAGRTLLLRLAGSLPGELAGLPILGFSELRLDERVPSEQTEIDVWGSGIDLHLRLGPLHDRRGTCLGWVIVARDITESNRRRREAEETAVQLRRQLDTIEALRANLAEQATRDSLTGLHNRRYLLGVLRTDAVRVTAGIPFSLALVDLDHFKRINDTHGHGAGDQVLVRAAQVLAGAVRPGDVVARYGGEEFVVVFRGLRLDEAGRRTDALRELLRGTRIEVNGKPLSVTFSAGVAQFEPARDIEGLLRTADEALYEAKRLGRDRVTVAAPTTRLEAETG